MRTLLTIAGGVALILFGVRFLRKGLDRLFGPRLGQWMQGLAKSRLRAFWAGLWVSVLAPSSTTMSLLAVQTVQANHLPPQQALAVLLGANIGLTITVQLIALQVDQYAPLLILVGVVMFQFMRVERYRGVGQVILSLGFIFLAVWLIKLHSSIVAQQITPESDLGRIIFVVEKYPIWLTLLAAVLTTALQSSTATIGLLIGLGAASLQSLAIAVPAVLGANVGMGLTTLVAGWTDVNSRRMATANLLLKVGAAAVLLAVLPQVISGIERLPGGFAGQVAHTHTAFNILLAIVGLPLVRLMGRWMERLIPSPPASQPEKFGPKYISSTLPDSVALALGQSTREILRVSEIVRAMLDDLWRAMQHNDEHLVRAVSTRDDEVDLLDAQIKRFLTRLGGQVDEVANSRDQIFQLSYLSELETIGDIIDKNLSELVIKKIRLGVNFSREGWDELNDFYRKVAENLLIADTAFHTRDPMLAQQILRHKEHINNWQRELRQRHFARLNAGLVESLETSAIHLDLLTDLKRINSCLSHVAYAILQGTQTGNDRAE